VTRAALIRRAPKPRPGADRLYCEFVRCFACIVCARRWIGQCDGPEYGQASPTECAHVGRRGLGQRCPDRECLPLCRKKHHQFGPHSHHVLGKRFWSFHGLDRVALITQLQQIYFRETGL
jgi:hypothetical protein